MDITKPDHKRTYMNIVKAKAVPQQVMEALVGERSYRSY
jgi:hypothetical protein